MRQNSDILSGEINDSGEPTCAPDSGGAASSLVASNSRPDDGRRSPTQLPESRVSDNLIALGNMKHKIIAIALRAVSYSMLAFAVLSGFAAVQKISRLIRVAIDPSRSFNRPTAWEFFLESTREMTLSLGLLSVPLALLVLQNAIETRVSPSSKSS